MKNLNLALVALTLTLNACVLPDTSSSDVTSSAAKSSATQADGREHRGGSEKSFCLPQTAAGHTLNCVAVSDARGEDDVAFLCNEGAPANELQDMADSFESLARWGIDNGTPNVSIQGNGCNYTKEVGHCAAGLWIIVEGSQVEYTGSCQGE